MALVVQGALYINACSLVANKTTTSSQLRVVRVLPWEWTRGDTCDSPLLRSAQEQVYEIAGLDMTAECFLLLFIRNATRKLPVWPAQFYRVTK